MLAVSWVYFFNQPIKLLTVICHRLTIYHFFIILYIRSSTTERSNTMISSQVSFLLRYGLYQFGETVFKNGRISPYTVRLQQYPPNELFQFLAQLAWNLEQLASLQAIHCFGIAKSGIRLATAIYEHGLRLGKHAELSIL